MDIAVSPHREYAVPSLPGTGAESSAADLAAELAAAWEGLSANIVIGWVLRPLAKKTGRAVQGLAFTALVLLVGTTGALLTGEPPSMLVLQGWAATLLAAVLLAFGALARTLLRTLRDEVLPGVPPEALATASARLSGSTLLRWEPLLSWGIGLLTALLLAPGLYLILGIVAPFTYAVVAIGSAMTVSLIYIPASITVALLHITAGEIVLPPFMPEGSRLVQGWNSITRRVSSTAALVATIGVLGPFLIPGLGGAAAVVAILVFTGATSAVLVQIVLQQVRLGNLIGRHHRRISRGLLAEITECYERRHDPDEEVATRMELLVHFQKLADPARGRRSWLAGPLRQLAPMSLPLLSLLAGTVDIPFIGRDTVIFLFLEKLLDFL